MMNFIWVWIFSSIHFGIAAPHIDLELRSDYQFIEENLTTEKVWAADPNQINPHLQRWVLRKKIELVGLAAYSDENGLFRVKAQGINAEMKGLVRPEGPWYLDYTEFTCEKAPDSWFETREGAQLAAAKAAEFWTHALKIEKDKLALLLERVKGNTEKSALDFAHVTFQAWLNDLQIQWRVRDLPRIRVAQWTYFQQQAKEKGMCPSKSVRRSLDLVSSLRRSLMEQPAGKPPTEGQLIARTPARLWNGLFSIRLSLDVGSGRFLNGRFLIDSALKRSVISPSWLEGQGIYRAWVEMPALPPEHLTLRGHGLGRAENSLAKKAFIQRVMFSGVEIPLHEFLLAETELFSSPEHVGGCCDGVLGTDFLRQFVVEFQPASPTEVRIWPKESFAWSEDTPWVELGETPNGDLVSYCKVSSSKSSLFGVRWDLGSETALGIHTPWSALAKKETKPWAIECDALPIAEGVSSDLSGGRSDKIPAVSLGMPVLNRGNFTLDIPHGRLWFAKDGLHRSVPAKNKSGLKLEFFSVHHGRELRVKNITPRSPAASLGLKMGTVLTQVDGIPVEDMDLWLVEKHLAGDFGPVVTLQWLQGKTLKMAPLKLEQKGP